MGACYSARTPQAPDRPLMGGGRVGVGDVRCTGCQVKRNLYSTYANRSKTAKGG